MRVTGYVAVAVRRPGGVAVYGPWDSPQEARPLITRLLTDDRVWATRVAALTPPHTPPFFLPVPGADAMTVVEIPREVVDVLHAYPPSPPVGHAPAVVLALAGPPHHAVVVGPFPTGEEAIRWVVRHDLRARCLVLPLQPFALDTLGAKHTLPAVASITTTTGTALYGPFRGTRHAAHWFYNLISVIPVTHLEKAFVVTLTPPFDATEDAPTLHTAPYVPRDDTQLFVTAVYDTSQKMLGAVGFFDSHDTARAWWSTKQHHFPGARAKVFAVTGT